MKKLLTLCPKPQIHPIGSKCITIPRGTSETQLCTKKYIGITVFILKNRLIKEKKVCGLFSDVAKIFDRV